MAWKDRRSVDACQQQETYWKEEPSRRICVVNSHGISDSYRSIRSMMMD